jgi:dipeptidyl aminopeptidase/acylaminoacyl peptidase
MVELANPVICITYEAHDGMDEGKRMKFAIRLSVAVFVLAFIATPVLAKQAITHEDVWLMHRIGSPILSPDGKWVVVSVTEPSYESDETVRDLWLVPSDGSAPPRRLTSTPGSENGVAWSPDGSRIAFSAKRDRDEANQIYVLDMTGPGEAERVTWLSTGASAPTWSPDGKAIAFESRVYPGAVDDEANKKEATKRKDRKHNTSAYDGFPIRYFDHWLDDRETHLFVQSLDPPEDARDLLAGTKLVEEVGFSASSGGSLQATWAPDGAALVFAATTNRHEAAYAFTRFHLYKVSAKGGEPERLTNDDADYGSPAFGPDGTSLYCLREPITDYVYNLTRLARFGWPDLGEPEIMSRDFDRAVSDFDLMPDGETIFVLANDAGRRRMYALDANGKNARLLDENGRGVYASPATTTDPSAALTLVARWEDSTHPAEIVRIDPKTGKHEPLTSFNVARAAEIDWQPFREFWFTSAKGRRIHNWIALPAGFDESKKYPLLLFIHGGPHSTSLDSGHIRWSAQLLAAPGYVVLMTDYTGSVGYGEEFSRLIQGDPLKTPGDEVLEAADEAIRRFSFIDETRQAAAGASYGGHMVNWLQATTTRFRCLIGHAGLISLEGQWATSDGIYHREINNGGPPWGGSSIWREQSPSSYAGDFKTPMMLTIGEKDYRVPLNQTLAAWSYLKRNKVPSRLIVFHDANHWIMRGHDAKYFWSEVHAWLAKYL